MNGESIIEEKEDRNYEVETAWKEAWDEMGETGNHLNQMTLLLKGHNKSPPRNTRPSLLSKPTYLTRPRLHQKPLGSASIRAYQSSSFLSAASFLDLTFNSYAWEVISHYVISMICSPYLHR
jgi:hypothetical protein